MASQGFPAPWTNRRTRTLSGHALRDADMTKSSSRPGRLCDAEPPEELSSDVPVTQALPVTRPKPLARSEAPPPQAQVLRRGASHSIYVRTKAREGRGGHHSAPPKGKETLRG